MKTANLLLTRFCILIESALILAFMIFGRKSHKPEVGSSSLPLTTTSKKQSQNIQITVYTAIVGCFSSLLLVKNSVWQFSRHFFFSSKMVYFVDFYCKLTANSATRFFSFRLHYIFHFP